MTRVSGVPVRMLLNELRPHPVSHLLASALLVALFATGVDWTRWWPLITVDVGIVYILCAINRPEIERKPSKRIVLVFVYLVLALAVIPTGAANNVGVWTVHLF